MHEVSQGSMHEVPQGPGQRCALWASAREASGARVKGAPRDKV
jgi:hypothetical protein